MNTAPATDYFVHVMVSNAQGFGYGLLWPVGEQCNRAGLHAVREEFATQGKRAEAAAIFEMEKERYGW